MLDALVRPLIDPPLDVAGRWLSARGVTANQVTSAGLAAGVGAGAAMASEAYVTGAVLVLLNRLLDGLDGGVARVRGLTEFGAYLDIVADFVFYAAVPVGFALSAPERQLPAVWLLAGFLASGTSFLAWAALAARRGLTTAARGHKGFYYVGGLAEGTETTAVFVGCALAPAWFPTVAVGFAVVCGLTAVGRLALAWRTFGRTPPAAR